MKALAIKSHNNILKFINKINKLKVIFNEVIKNKKVNLYLIILKQLINNKILI